MQQVAEHAGVSAMTVSNVLNGRKVSPETRTAVLRAVDALHYVPNPAARQLASAQSLAVGLLHGGFEHAFFSAILVGALNAATRLGVQLLLEQVDFADPETGWAAIDALRGRGARAVLLPPVLCEALAADPRIAQVELPLMGVATGLPLTSVSCVRIDEQAAAREITGLLVAKGHRRIGYIGPPVRLSISTGRRGGYLEALAAGGLAADPALMVEDVLSFEAALAAAQHLLDLPDPPTAIFASNDDMAAAALTAAHMRGLATPGALAVAGFDDGPLATKVWPPLTTVRQPAAEMAGLAVEKLTQQARRGIDNRQARKTTTYLDYAVVRRASTGD
jgi:LacI family transcriptional regulator